MTCSTSRASRSARSACELEPLDAAELVAGRRRDQPAADREEPAPAVGLACPTSRCCSCGDRARLTQVLANLLNNAAKYTPPRRRDLAVAGARRRRRGRFASATRASAFRADMLDRVFDLFTQIDNSLDRAQGGLGIGLTLVRELVELHGGSVEVASDGPNQGCEFSVRIPQAGRGPAVSRTTGRSAKSRRSTPRRALALQLARMHADSLTAAVCAARLSLQRSTLPLAADRAPSRFGRELSQYYVRIRDALIQCTAIASF